MDELRYSDSIVIARSPETLYDMVTDIARTGEWSPVCKACWWDEGSALGVGSWFTGRNETPERSWETRSEVVVAERGRAFAFIVGGTWTRWSYTFAASDEGTVVTESWEFLPGGITRFEERFGDDAMVQVADRFATARQGIPETLAALKSVAESE
jgi:hypothetical protein